MLQEKTLFAFVIISVLIELTPGPNMAYLGIISVLHGRMKGFAVAAGISLGLLIVGLFALYGLGEWISDSEIISEVLRWCGFLYLLWIAKDGWYMGDIHVKKDMQQQSYWKFFRQGVLINLLNPKAMVFYITVLPAFISASTDFMQSSMSLTVIYVMIATVVHFSICLLGGATQNFFKNTQRIQIVSKVLSVLLVFVALWFLWTTR